MDFSTYGQGKCVNCGFLCKRPQPAYYLGYCHEADTDTRQNGNFSQHLIAINEIGMADGYIEKHQYVSTFPWCFVGKVNFLEEITNPQTQFDKMREITLRERNCPSWYPWTEFLSPKEHFEEFKMQQLEKERREFELKLEEINRQERKRTDRVMIWLTIAAVLFAALQVYAALATINPNSWLFNWLR